MGGGLPHPLPPFQLPAYCLGLVGLPSLPGHLGREPEGRAPRRCGATIGRRGAPTPGSPRPPPPPPPCPPSTACPPPSAQAMHAQEPGCSRPGITGLPLGHLDWGNKKGWGALRNPPQAQPPDPSNHEGIPYGRHVASAWLPGSIQPFPPEPGECVSEGHGSWIFT